MAKKAIFRAPIIMTILGVTVLIFAWSQFNSHNPKWDAYEKLSNDVYSNNLTAVQDDLKKGTNPNKFPNDAEAVGDERDSNALCIAAEQGNVPMVELLLDHGADPNMGDGWHENPLTAAAGAENIEAMKLLIARGALVNDQPQCSEALWCAATEGKLRSLKFLLDQGANPNSNAFTDKPESLLSATKSLDQQEAAIMLEKAGAKE